MWQCCWMRMGNPYFLWRLQHLCNHVCEHKGQFGSVIFSMRVNKLKSTKHASPEKSSYLPKAFQLPGPCTESVVMAVTDRACNEWQKLVRMHKGHNNTLPAQHCPESVAIKRQEQRQQTKSYSSLPYSPLRGISGSQTEDKSQKGVANSFFSFSAPSRSAWTQMKKRHQPV